MKLKLPYDEFIRTTKGCAHRPNGNKGWLSGRPSRKVTHHKTRRLWHDNIPGLRGKTSGPAACCCGHIHHRPPSNKDFRLPSVTPRQRDGVGMTVHVGPFGLSMWCNGWSEGSSGDCCQAALACIRAVVSPTIHGPRRGMARSRGSHRRWTQ